MRPGTTPSNLHSKAIKGESKMQTCTREGVEPEGKTGGEHGPFGETPLEALTCPPVGLACSPFHTLNLPLRQPMPFRPFPASGNLRKSPMPGRDLQVTAAYRSSSSPTPAQLQGSKPQERWRGGISTFQRGGSVSTGVGSLGLRVVPFSGGPLRGRGN